MSSRDEINHLVNHYGFTIDTGDLDGFASLFEHGDWGLEGSRRYVGKDGLLEMMADVVIYPDGTPRTKHLTASYDLDIDEGAETAKGQCYVTVLQQTDDFPLQVIFAGHYFGEFERVDGAWRFVKRIVRHALVGDMSAHLKPTSGFISAH